MACKSRFPGECRFSLGEVGDCGDVDVDVVSNNCETQIPAARVRPERVKFTILCSSHCFQEGWGGGHQRSRKKNLSGYQFFPFSHPLVPTLWMKAIMIRVWLFYDQYVMVFLQGTWMAISCGSAIVSRGIHDPHTCWRLGVFLSCLELGNLALSFPHKLRNLSRCTEGCFQILRNNYLTSNRDIESRYASDIRLWHFG